jgi:ubiquinone biosynthesis O-methyltransferase
MSQLSAIDVGCGAGILSESLGRLGIGSVLGLDPTEKCIELATTHLESSKKADAQLASVRYENSTLEKHLEEGKTYDLVCCSEVIEHVSN